MEKGLGGFVCEAMQHTSIKYLERSCDTLYDALQNRNFLSLSLSRDSTPDILECFK